METTYGTKVVGKLDTISALVGAIEIPNRLGSMQLDVLTRMDAIIVAVQELLGGGGPGGGTPPAVSPVKHFYVSQPTVVPLDTTDGWFYKFDAITSFRLRAFDFSYSRKIHVVVDNISATPINVFFEVANFIPIYMDFNVVSVPMNKSLEVTFLSLDDDKIRVTSNLQN